jgi:hypothetical protein
MHLHENENDQQLTRGEMRQSACYFVLALCISKCVASSTFKARESAATKKDIQLQISNALQMQAIILYESVKYKQKRNN